MVWEGEFLLWIQNSLRNADLDALLSAYTHLGDAGLLFIIIGIGMLCFPRTRRAGLVGLTALLLGFAGTNLILKHLVARPRPWLDVAGLLPLVEEGDPNSFPSGHATAAFAFAGAMVAVLPVRWAKALLLGAAVLMGFSRLYVGVHYPTDVLAGVAVGLLAGWLASLLWKKFFSEKKMGA